MRSFIARLSLAGIVGIALAGCSSGGTALPTGGSGGGNGSVPGTGGVGALATCSKTPEMIDTGNAVNILGTSATFSGFQGFVFDVQGLGDPTGDDLSTAGGIGWTTVPSCAPPEPQYNGVSSGYGYQDFELDGSTTTQVILKDTNAIPNLTYNFGYAGNSYNFNFTAIVFHMGWPLVASLSVPSSVSIELVGSGASSSPGALAATYDVRNPCTIYPTGAIAPTPAWSTLVCPLNGGATAYGTAKNTQGPNAVIPGATGTFTPINPTLYLVFNYGKAVNPSDQANAYFTYMYAYQ
jgi:hypothetical protein